MKFLENLLLDQERMNENILGLRTPQLESRLLSNAYRVPQNFYKNFLID